MECILCGFWASVYPLYFVMLLPCWVADRAEHKAQGSKALDLQSNAINYPGWVSEYSKSDVFASTWMLLYDFLLKIKVGRLDHHHRRPQGVRPVWSAAHPFKTRFQVDANEPQMNATLCHASRNSKALLPFLCKTASAHCECGDVADLMLDKRLWWPEFCSPW